MVKIAVVQNGTDVARSSWADVADTYRACAALLSDEVLTVTVEFFADEVVGRMLAELDRDTFACVVFTSNALTSDQVHRAVVRHLEQLHGYLAKGGGLVVLHQWLDSLSPVIPDRLCPTMATRQSAAPDPNPVHPFRRDDVLLHYPVEVAVDRLRDGGHESGPAWLFYKALDLPALPDALKAVLVRDETEAVVVRTDDHVPERIVISTALLDWQHNMDLLVNAMRWAAFGSPHRLVRRGEEAAPTKFLHRWLRMDGSSTFSVAVEPGASLSGAERWLLTDPESQLEVFIVPADHLPVTHDQPEVIRFLERGGTLLTADAETKLAASRVSVFVGHYAERTLAREFYAELRAVSGWNSVESAFDVRNIVGALVLLWADEPNRTPAAVSPAEVAGLGPEIRTRLSTTRHQEDVASSIALAQTLALLGAGPEADLGLVDWMFERPLARSFDVRLQLIAVRAGWAGRPEPGYVASACAELEQAAPGLASVSPVVRILDSVALLGQLGLLEAKPAEIAAIGELVADLLDAFPAQPEMGWVSVEASADVVRGLIALLDVLPAEHDVLAARLADHAVTGADVLQRALRRYERNVRGVAWRARLTHGLVLAARYFPIGLQRLSTLQWPDSGFGPSAGTPGTGSPVTERSLVEHLGAENKRLQARQEESAATIRDKDVLLTEQQLATRVGRVVATWLPIVLLVVGAVSVAVAVGVQSVWSLIANIGVLLAALVTLLALLFAGLARVHLLSPSGRTVQIALEKAAVPLLTSLGKVRGR
jgi:hypothetical protein